MMKSRPRVAARIASDMLKPSRWYATISETAASGSSYRPELTRHDSPSQENRYDAVLPSKRGGRVGTIRHCHLGTRDENKFTTQDARIQRWADKRRQRRQRPARSVQGGAVGNTLNSHSVLPESYKDLISYARALHEQKQWPLLLDLLAVHDALDISPIHKTRDVPVSPFDGTPLSQKQRSLLYEITILSLFHRGRDEEALWLLKQAMERGVPLRLKTINQGIESARRLARWQDARLILASMLEPDNNLPAPDVITYNTVLTACARCRRPRVVLALFKELLQKEAAQEGTEGTKSYLPNPEFKTDTRTYTIVLSALARDPEDDNFAEETKAAYQIWGAMVNGNMKSVSPSALAACEIMRIYRSNGEFDKVFEVFESAKSLGIDRELRLYQALLKTYAHNNDWKAAWDLITKRMPAEGFQPDKGAARDAIRACARAGEVGHAIQLIDDDSLRMNTRPDAMDYSPILDALGRQGNKDIATALFSEIDLRSRFPPNHIHRRAVVAAFQTYGDEYGALAIMAGMTPTTTAGRRARIEQGDDSHVVLWANPSEFDRERLLGRSNPEETMARLEMAEKKRAINSQALANEPRQERIASSDELITCYTSAIEMLGYNGRWQEALFLLHEYAGYVKSIGLPGVLDGCDEGGWSDGLQLASDSFIPALEACKNSSRTAERTDTHDQAFRQLSIGDNRSPSWLRDVVKDIEAVTEPWQKLLLLCEYMDNAVGAVPGARASGIVMQECVQAGQGVQALRLFDRLDNRHRKWNGGVRFRKGNTSMPSHPVHGTKRASPVHPLAPTILNYQTALRACKVELDIDLVDDSSSVQEEGERRNEIAGTVVEIFGHMVQESGLMVDQETLQIANSAGSARSSFEYATQMKELQEAARGRIMSDQSFYGSRLRWGSMLASRVSEEGRSLFLPDTKAEDMVESEQISH